MINIYSQSGQVTYGIKYYTVDTEDEKNSLPTKDKMGSKCYVIESKTWYILNGNEEWVPFVGEDSTADAILISIKNMSAEQKDQLKEELDIEGGGSDAVSSVNGKTGAVVLDANDIGALPNDTPIPAAVTEQTVSGWGFTKNTGTYTKPMGGIPDSDIASAEMWNAKGTYSKPSDGIPASDLAAGVIPDISGKANAADVYTKTEVDQKLVGVMDYKGTKATVSALPTSGNETGDVWHITADGSEWAWNGSTWEELGSAVDLSGYRTASAQDVIDAAQDSAIAAKGTYSKPSGGIPKSDLSSAVQTSLGKADTALQAAPVTSVNGRTGAVLLDANDVGALPSATDTDVSGGGTFEPVDMSSGVEVFANRKWLKSGSYVEPTGWYGSNKIPVVPGMTYKVYNNPRYYYLYDENGSNGTEMGTATSISEFEFTAPSGCFFVAFFHNSGNARQMQMFRVTPTPEEEAALSVALKSDVFSLTKQNLKRTSVVELLAPLKNKNIVNFGDSIFGNFSAPEDVSTYLAAYTGAEVYNCGFGGTMMTTHWNANYALFSFHALVDAIVSGDWSAQDAAIADSEWAKPEAFAPHLATLKALDFSEVDIITIAYGTNDWNSGRAIDNAQNPKDLTAYCGAFRYSIEKLLTTYPHLRVFTCTPIFRTQLDENTHEPIQYSDTWQNTNGKTLPDFCAALRNVSAEYGLKCIDNYYELGFNKLNRTLYYRENDGTHPSVEGRKRIARNITDGITSAGVGWPVLTDAATQEWVQNQGYLTLADLPVYNGGVT